MQCVTWLLLQVDQVFEDALSEVSPQATTASNPLMDGYRTQLGDQSGAVNGPHSPGYDLEFHNVLETLKQTLLNRVEEERKMKSLDKILNILLLGAVATVYINYFATTQYTSRLYPSRTTLVAGLDEVFRTASNGTFTSRAFLMIFGAPSFTSWALQSLMDICLFVPHLIVIAAIYGKWVLGHSNVEKNRDAQIGQRRLQNWPKYTRARVLSSLDALPVLFALSQGIFPLCLITAQHPLVGTFIVIILCVFRWLMCLYYQELMASHL